MNDKFLERAIKELAVRESEFIEATFDLPEKKHAYKLKYSVCLQKAEGSVVMKEAQAMEMCAAEYLEYQKAEARAEVAKTLLYDCRSVMEARRSLLSNEKSEREFAASGAVA